MISVTEQTAPTTDAFTNDGAQGIYNNKPETSSENVFKMRCILRDVFFVEMK